jgi:NitT/TauT family transport system substrate-binding protein
MGDARKTVRGSQFRRLGLAVAAGWAAAIVVAATAQAAEHLKIGTLLTTGACPLYLWIEKGYFAQAGFDVELVPFDAGQPVAVATVSGDIDFGIAGVTSALYTMAAQGTLRIIGGWGYDRPNFHAAAVLASNRAYDAGLTSLKSLGGHSVALTQIGSTYHYALAILAEKYDIDLKTVRTLPLQSFPNVASAVAGGQADAGVVLSVQAQTMLDRSEGKLLAWVGEEVPWQVAAIWISTKTANERGDMVRRFMRTLANGAQECAEAFVGPGGTRRDGPSAPAALAMIGKYVNQPIAQMSTSVGYVDPDLRLDVKDIARQITWYRSQGMVKGEVTVDQVIDRRYVVDLPR